jgi:hypothetical protein
MLFYPRPVEEKGMAVAQMTDIGFFDLRCPSHELGLDEVVPLLILVFEHDVDAAVIVQEHAFLENRIEPFTAAKEIGNPKLKCPSALRVVVIVPAMLDARTPKLFGYQSLEAVRGKLVPGHPVDPCVNSCCAGLILRSGSALSTAQG